MNILAKYAGNTQNLIIKHTVSDSYKMLDSNIYRRNISTSYTVFSRQNLLLHRITVSIVYGYRNRIILIISLTVTFSCGCYSETCSNINFVLPKHNI